MTIPRVNPNAVTSIVEKSNLTQTDKDDQHRSALPASSTQPSAAVSLKSSAQRANLLANSARQRVGGAQKASRATPKASTSNAWNAGLALACDLMQALVCHGTDEAAGFPLHEFEEMIRALEPDTQAFQSMSSRK